MSKRRVHCFAVSLDGFGADPNQDINNPLGVGGEDLHQWFFPTRTFQAMQGKEEGTTGVDHEFRCSSCALAAALAMIATKTMQIFPSVLFPVAPVDQTVAAG